jgi:hypothetical protein
METNARVTRGRWRQWVGVPCIVLLVACPQSPPPPSVGAAGAPPGAETHDRVPPGNTMSQAAPEPPQLPLAPSPPAAANVAPAGPLYVCDVNGVRSAIAYEPRVDDLCRRHPEMSPCQYARASCRTRGGRVYAADGTEVTLAVEQSYDRKVDRVTFQADGPARPKR